MILSYLVGDRDAEYALPFMDDLRGRLERSSLSFCMHMRRYTRLTNAHSKKLEKHGHMASLHAVWYNFVRIDSADVARDGGGCLQDALDHG